jgi:hypothetical protein
MRRRIARLAVVLAITASGRAAHAQQPEPASGQESLDAVEARLAERYDRLEILAGRLAELSHSTQPRRAELLQQLVTAGRERDVPGQFDKLVAALRDERFSAAVEGQTRIEADLEKLLDLLLQEDRDRQLDTERKRITRYLQDLNRLIRLQRGVKARTDGGDEAPQLAADQKRVEGNAEELQKQIEEDEARAHPDDKPSDAADGSPREGDSSPSKPKDDAGDQSERPQGDSSGKQQPREQSGDQKPGEQSSEQQPGDQQSGPQQSGEQQSGSSVPSGESSDSQQQQTPIQRTAQRLQQAQQRMLEAAQRLEEAQRQGAIGEQEQALEQLELAKAELERILRQLREEEMERMLVLLEARFRKMLDDQVAVYEETTKVEAAKATAPEHEIEIAAGRLSRREQLIVREADRALVLLREDGTSVAFPEAVEQARDDMQQIAERLSRTQVDMLTQGMEEDVIASLEEILHTLREQLDELRDQRSQPQEGGEPGEQRLVDDLAELRMIRALQIRVNRRTQQYGALIEGEQAFGGDLIQMLEDLSLRQLKIFDATRDLEREANQ